MVKYRYDDNRSLPPNANILYDFRPSGLLRLIKGTLEYSFFQAVLTYGTFTISKDSHSMDLEFIRITYKRLGHK